MTSNTLLETDRGEFDGLVSTVADFLRQDVLDVVVDGEPIRGYRTPDAKSIWIRDYSDMMRGFRYFESDLKSTIDHFAQTQAANGRIFDYFTTFPEKLPSERENWTKYVRVPVEADVEYRFVKAVWLAWQAHGDDAWLADRIPAMESALRYSREHPWRWDTRLGLVKRAYTIDTWDFAYSAGRHDWLQFQIDDHTFWGILHGDNSGYYEAYRLLAAAHARVGDADRSQLWQERAEFLKVRLNEICWNGTFYTHFVKLTPVTIEGVDESRQLSLSNPMNISRGVCSQDQAVSILDEYRRRGKASSAFAEWFSIDPPFPDGIFGDEILKQGAYCNGGIMPLVGGELARAAFEHGRENYGVEILRRYMALIGERGETFLWYHPNGEPASLDTSTSPDAMPTDGWGSSAMLWALIEGLAGIQDRGKQFEDLRLAPRWPAAEVRQAEFKLEYPSSGAYVHYRYHGKQDRQTIEISGHPRRIEFHVLLPDRARARAVRADGQAVSYRESSVESSHYVDFSWMADTTTSIEIELSHA